MTKDSFSLSRTWNNLGVVCLKGASDQLADVDVQGHGRLHLQSYLYSSLLQCMHPNPLHTVLYDKLGRWIDADDLDGAVEYATKVLEMIHKSVPPCVRFCVCTAWCNAWCTSERFQGEGLCRLCGECSGADSLEHYAVCPFQWQLAEEKLGVRRGPHSVLRFMGLDANYAEELDLQVCHMYAVKCAMDLGRVRNVRWQYPSLRRLLWQGHKKIATHSAPVRRRYAQLWNLPAIH